MAAKAAVERGDGAGVAEAGVRTAAIGTAAYFGGTAGASAASAVLDTSAGRATSRFVGKSLAFIVTAGIAIMLAVIMFFTSIMGAVAAGIAGTDEDSAYLNCLTGVTDRADLLTLDQQNAAGELIAMSYRYGFGKNGAVIGVMGALKESGLHADTVPDKIPAGTQPPMIAAGIYQMEPWLYSQQSWPAGTVEGDANYLKQEYLDAALVNIMDTKYVGGKFYDAFNSNTRLTGGKWKKLDPWIVASVALNNLDDPKGGTYRQYYDRAKADVSAYLTKYPDLKAGTWVPLKPTDPLLDMLSNACAILTGGVDTTTIPGTYKIELKGTSLYRDGATVYPNVEIAMARAAQVVGHASIACSDGMCLSLCDHLAGWIWGYSNSGYVSAKKHWEYAVANGFAHPGDFNPPIGADLFWNTGVYGHIATYVGGGYVVSNLRGSEGNNVYLMPADWWTARAPYFGWADPKFRGAKISGTGL